MGDFPTSLGTSSPGPRAITSSQQLLNLEYREKENKLFFLFGPPSAKNLIASIAATEPVFMLPGDIIWAEFEDGFPNILIRNVEAIRNRDVVFIADFLNPREMFNQLSVLYALPRYLVRSMTVILAYFPTGTMERVEYEGQIATAHTLSKLFSAIPLTVAGPVKLVIYDIHALQERFYFGESVIPVMATAVPLIIDVLRTKHPGEKIAIAFPDEGAQKRFGRDFDEFPHIICSKVREGDKRVVKVKEGDVEGYHVFIVDDLVKTGGTLIECKNVLLANKASKVSAYVTHAVFPQDSWKRFTVEGPNQFKTFYTTDSCPSVAKILSGVKPFEVLSLAASMTQIIMRYS